MVLIGKYIDSIMVDFPASYAGDIIHQLICLILFLSLSTFNFTIIEIMGILATPPKATPPRNKGLIRSY